MKNLITRTTARFLKSCLIFMLPAVIFCGCQDATKTVHRKFTLSIHNGSGWSSGSSTIECDSFQMIGTKKAEIWCDGFKQNIECNDVIYPISN